MGKITTADCKRFLDGHASRFTANMASLLSLQASGEWVRLRKYKDRDGITCRDFANRGLPVVAILSEEAGELVLKRERALCVWESAFLRQFPDVDIEGDPRWTSWADHVMWPSLRAEDFRFGVGPGPSGNAGEVSFFFQPCGTSEEEPWDQHLPVIHGLIPRQIAGYEIVECSYGFSRQGDPAKYVDVRADLVAAGFTHDRKLDGM